jgi:hypothetical protein
MTRIPSKSTLSAARRKLVEAMQRLNFGRIEELNINNGEPTFSPPPRLIEDIKLGGETGPRSELEKKDFLLRSCILELFGHIERLGTGTIACVEVRYGLPTKITLERSVR